MSQLTDFSKISIISFQAEISMCILILMQWCLMRCNFLLESSNAKMIPGDSPSERLPR